MSSRDGSRSLSALFCSTVWPPINAGTSCWRRGGVRTGFWSLLQIQFAANFLGSFLPSSVGTDAIRMAALCRKGAPAPAVIAATLVDRISLAIATLLLGAGMLLLFAHRFVPDELAEMVLGVTGLVLVCGLMCLHKSVRTWIRLKLLPYVPSRFQKTLHEVADAALTYRHEYRAMVQLALVTILVFAIRIYFVWVLASAVGLDLSLLKLTIVIPILWLIVMLPITIGGIGVQDAGYVALMAFIGVPAALAVSISLLEHVIVRIVSLPGAFFVGNMAIKGGSPAMADSSAKAG